MNSQVDHPAAGLDEIEFDLDMETQARFIKNAKTALKRLTRNIHVDDLTNLYLSHEIKQQFYHNMNPLLTVIKVGWKGVRIRPTAT